MTTALAGVPGDPGDGRQRGRTQLARPPGRRPWSIAAGLLLMLGSSLTAVVLVGRPQGGVPVLVLVHDVAAGEAVTAADLGVVEIVPAGGIGWIPAERRSQVVGLAAGGPLPAGQLLTEGSLAPSAQAIGRGRVLVALALRAGDLPATAAPGDRVSLQAPAVGAGAAVDPGGPRAVAIGEGRLWSVVTGPGGGVVVTVAIDRSLESAVSGASMAGAMKLNLVGG